MSPAWTVFDKGAGAARVFVTVVAMLVRPGTGFAFIQHRVAVGTVVRHEDDDGVVVLAALFQVLDHAADLCVHGFHHGGVDSHTLAFDALLFWLMASHISEAASDDPLSTISAPVPSSAQRKPSSTPTIGLSA